MPRVNLFQLLGSLVTHTTNVDTRLQEVKRDIEDVCNTLSPEDIQQFRTLCQRIKNTPTTQDSSLQIIQEIESLLDSIEIQ